jgi:hypothetical protein
VGGDNNNNNNNNGTSWDRQRPATFVVSETALLLLTACQAKPAFCKTPEEKVGKTTPATTATLGLGLGGSNVLVDGLVGFRHTQASSVVPEDEATSVRKERAKILSKLVVLQQQSVTTTATTTTTTPPPPTKGATIVVSVPHDQVACDSLRRIFYLLGSYYNLFVILAVPEPPMDVAISDTTDLQMQTLEQQKEALVSKLRGTNDTDTMSTDTATATILLSEAVLPSHRILLSTTIAGRVAFVRQLNRVELVVDFDGLVQVQLTRFGYRVFLYGNGNGGLEQKATTSTTTSTELSIVSGLGAELLVSS